MRRAVEPSDRLQEEGLDLDRKQMRRAAEEDRDPEEDVPGRHRWDAARVQDPADTQVPARHEGCVPALHEGLAVYRSASFLDSKLAEVRFGSGAGVRESYPVSSLRPKLQTDRKRWTLLAPSLRKLWTNSVSYF